MPLFYSQVGLTNQDYLKRKKEKEFLAQERKNKRNTDKSLQNIHPKNFYNVGSVNHIHDFPKSFNNEKNNTENFNQPSMNYTKWDKYQTNYNQGEYHEKYKNRPLATNQNNDYAYNHGYDIDYHRGNFQNSYKISEEDDRLSKVSK